MMVFPWIPAEVEQELPTQPEIHFIHPHNLGKFSFIVQKSPAGFNVTVRPLLGEPLVDTPAPPSAPDQMPVADTNDGSAFSFETNGAVESDSMLSLDDGFLPSVAPAEREQSDKAELPHVGSEDDEERQMLTSFAEEAAPMTQPTPFDPRPSNFIPPPEEFILETEPPPSAQEPAVEAPVQGVDSSGALIVDRRVSDRRKVNSVMRDRMEALFKRRRKPVHPISICR
jgi:hypothetical protein